MADNPRQEIIMKKSPKRLHQLVSWLNDRITDWNNSWDGTLPLAPSASPLVLIDTGTMKFEVSEISVQHGGPLDGAIVLKMGEPAE